MRRGAGGRCEAEGDGHGPAPRLGRAGGGWRNPPALPPAEPAGREGRARRAGGAGRPAGSGLRAPRSHGRRRQRPPAPLPAWAGGQGAAGPSRQGHDPAGRYAGAFSLKARSGAGPVRPRPPGFGFGMPRSLSAEPGRGGGLPRSAGAGGAGEARRRLPGKGRCPAEGARPAPVPCATRGAVQVAPGCRCACQPRGMARKRAAPRLEGRSGPGRGPCRAGAVPASALQPVRAGKREKISCVLRSSGTSSQGDPVRPRSVYLFI